MKDHELIALLAISVMIYFAIMLIGYNKLNKQVADERIDLLPAEAALIMRMLLFWPFWWSEIQIVLKHAARKK